MTLHPGTSLGRYKINSLVGEGGMGEVYLAEDTRLRRRVALKLLPVALSADKERIARFEREAYAASSLSHPNILTIYEIGAEDGQHFIATEFIEGESLRQRMQRERLLPDESLEIGIQVASALAAAHAASVVHRDIKPENIMVRRDGIVKVLDFGLAKFIEQERPAPDTQAPTRGLYRTEAGVVMGTVSYMSPEQARGLEVDARTDVWSLGVVLYEMLTGRQPFKGGSIPDLLASILRSEATPPRVYAAGLPAELDPLVLKTLCKDREERYRSAQDLLVDLRQLQKRLEFEAELARTGVPERAGQSRLSGNATPAGFGAAKLKADEQALHEGETIKATTPDRPPNNLSMPRTKIVGREGEINQLALALRRADTRLLTLTGVGGTGKTTLALAVARELSTEFADGVFLVELAAITSPELVASTIAQPLCVKEAGGKSVVEILKEHLRVREVLLVIDNFEQVNSAAPLLAELLAAAPRLKVMVTSRAPLHLSTEREYAVLPLAVPEDFATASSDELSRYEAVRLFVERAQMVKPRFALTNDNAQSVAEICTRLDGLPLAIELAAARVRVLSPQAILTKLEHRLRLLTGGARDLPARQQTMRGAVEWSYELLTEDEKRLFRRLAVFAGGFRFEAAESVMGALSSADGNRIVSDEHAKAGDRQLTIDILDGITSLVDKSLLAQKEQADGEPRFRMLEVVREYALDALEAAGESETMRRSHAAYFLALGEEAEPHLRGAQSVEWLNRLEEEHDNVRVALQWTLENDADSGLRLAGAISLFWNTHSHYIEGRKWLEQALARSVRASASARAKALNGAGQLAQRQGDYQAARNFYVQSLHIGKETGDKRQIAVSCNGLGLMSYLLGHNIAAHSFLENSLPIGRELGDKALLSITLITLGELTRIEGNYVVARSFYEEALALAREIGHKEKVSVSLLNLGAVSYQVGDFAAAHSSYMKALAIAQELRYKTGISLVLDGLAALTMQHGGTKRAAELAGAAEALRAEIGYKLEIPDRRFRDAYLAELRAVLNEADFADAYAQGRTLKPEEALALALAE
jgi:predicted ATPase/serine/threonine protein kinase